MFGMGKCALNVPYSVHYINQTFAKNMSISEKINKNRSKLARADTTKTAYLN